MYWIKIKMDIEKDNLIFFFTFIVNFYYKSCNYCTIYFLYYVFISIYSYKINKNMKITFNQ